MAELREDPPSDASPVVTAVASRARSAAAGEALTEARAGVRTCVGALAGRPRVDARRGPRRPRAS